MESFVCGRFIDRYLIANRFKPLGLVISEEMFKQLVVLQDSQTPEWTIELLKKIGYTGPQPQRLGEIILVRDSMNELAFGKASYEITEKCNYKCRHCFLGEESDREIRELSLSDKKRILEIIKASGVFWLQITGGEPFVSRDFVDVYRFAYSLGLLIIISTNGSLLTRADIKNILSACPPYRIAISMYGATAFSYESLTRMPGSFQDFCQGLEWLQKTGIRTRANIIITRYNREEMGAMKDWAERLKFEHHVFSTLSPTLKGNTYPLEIMGEFCGETKTDSEINGAEPSRNLKCMAGRTFFHVNSIGEASICKGAREPAVNILKEGIAKIQKLSEIANRLLQLPVLCQSCEFQNSCSTCPPQLALYQKSDTIPLNVCKKLSKI